MALIKCPECDGNLSTTAPSCPHCGSTVHRHEQQTASEAMRQNSSVGDGNIECPKCRGRFYGQALKCPHCGSTAHKDWKRQVGLDTSRKPEKPLGIFKLIAIVIGSLWVISWFVPDSPKSSSSYSSSSSSSSAAARPAVPAVPADKVCRAAVAAIMGQSFSIVSSTSTGGGTFKVSYTRPADGKVWDYKCKLQGDKVIWGAIDGRWRTHPDDAVVTYRITGNTVTISEKYGNHSPTIKNYNLDQL